MMTINPAVAFGMKLCVSFVFAVRLVAQNLLYEFQPPAPRNDRSYGAPIAAVGDLDQDGISDFVIGSPGDGWSANEGRIYVHSGKTGQVLREILGFSPNGIGRVVDSAGDWNLDGHADILSNFGPDKVVVLSGKDGTTLATFSPPSVVGTPEWRMGADYDRDGRRDLLLGQPSYISSGTIRCGRILAISGSDGLPMWEFLPDSQVAGFVGAAVCALGDIDGDGVPDCAASTDATYLGIPGSVYLVSGRTGSLIRRIPAWGFQFDFFGRTLASAGDLDRDGKCDIVIGGNGFTAGTRTKAGRVAVYSGATGTILPGLDWTGGTTLQQLGSSVANVGDFNNDGWDDVAAGSFYIPASGTPYYGKVTVFSGKDGSLLLELSGTSGTQQALLGRSVASAGDVNHDGSADLMLGVYSQYTSPAYSKVRVHAGIPNSGVGNPLYQAPVLYSLRGNATHDQYGMAVHGGGDLNGDGHPDFLVGANAVDVGSLVNAGEVRAHSGRGGAVLYSFRGTQMWNYLGDAVRIVKDVNHDGRADILLGGHGYSNGTLIDAGRATLYSGADGSLLQHFVGTQALQGFGQYVASAGDVDRDGDGDILICASAENRFGSRSGCVYLHGGANRSYALIQRFDGDSAGDEFGTSADGIGDVNGDGHDDIAIGAPFDDNASLVDCGSVKVFSGKDGTLLRSRFGVAANDRFGAALAGVGDVDRDGFGDYVVGAPNAAPKIARSGRAYLFSGRTGAILSMFDGELLGDRLGSSVAKGGDVDKDGTPDIVLGAPGAGSLGTAGRALVFSGRTGRLLYWLEGAATDDNGLSVAGAGDITGDGYADLVVGAPQLSSQAGAGLVHVISGTDAASFTFGLGCPGTGGKVPEILGIGAPRIGNASHRVDLQSARSSAAAALAVGAGSAPLPLGGSCTLIPVNPVTVPFTTSGAGSMSLPLPVPALPSLVGASLFGQFVILDPAGAGLGTLAVSQGLHLLIGR